MKIIDQNNRPITDPSTLPNVEPSGGSFPAVLRTKERPGTPALPPVLGTTSDDDHGGDSSGQEDDDEADPKLNRRDYLIKRLRRMQDRLKDYEQQTMGQKVSLTLMSAAVAIGLAIDHAAELPDDWKPVRTAAPITELAVGSTVVIRSSFRKFYQDDLSEAEMDGLVVHRLGEKRLRCKTTDGAVVLVPSGHVQLA